MYQEHRIPIHPFSICHSAGTSLSEGGGGCKGTTSPRPTSEDNPTIHHPSETYEHPLRRSLKVADPRLLSVSYLFIHYRTISLFITALFVTYLRHIPY